MLGGSALQVVLVPRNQFTNVTSSYSVPNDKLCQPGHLLHILLPDMTVDVPPAFAPILSYIAVSSEYFCSLYEATDLYSGYSVDPNISKVNGESPWLLCH